MNYQPITRRALALIVILAACLSRPPLPARAQSGAISGLVFADANGNGTREPGEVGMANVTLTFSSGGSGPVTGTTNADGGYFFTANVGTWTVTVIPPPGFQAVGLAGKEVTIASADQSVSLDFGLAPVQVSPTVTPIPVGPTATPGVLPQTGAPINWAGGALLALLGTLLAGVALVVTAWTPRRK